MSKDHHKQ